MNMNDVYQWIMGQIEMLLDRRNYQMELIKGWNEKYTKLCEECSEDEDAYRTIEDNIEAIYDGIADIDYDIQMLDYIRTKLDEVTE